MGYSYLIGVALAVFASVIKLYHAKPSGNLPSSVEARQRLLLSHGRRVVWMTGFVLVVLGSFADFVALGYAPQVIVAPLGSVTLVANVFFAPLLLGEKVTQLEIRSTVVIISGSTIAVLFASHEDKSYSRDQLFEMYTATGFLIYAIVVGFMVLFFLTLARHYDEIRESIQYDVVPQSPRYGASVPVMLQGTPIYESYHRHGIKVHRFLYPALSGLIGAQNVLFAKCTVELLADSFRGNGFMLGYLPSWIVVFSLGVTIYFQIMYLNVALSMFEASFCIPVFQTFWCLGSVASGLVYFGEYREMSVFRMIMFSVGILVTVSGLLMLSGRRVSASTRDSRVHSQDENYISRIMLRNRSPPQEFYSPASSPSTKRSALSGADSVESRLEDELDTSALLPERHIHDGDGRFTSLS